MAVKDSYFKTLLSTFQVGFAFHFVSLILLLPIHFKNNCINSCISYLFNGCNQSFRYAKMSIFLLKKVTQSLTSDKFLFTALQQLHETAAHCTVQFIHLCLPLQKCLTEMYTSSILRVYGISNYCKSDKAAQFSQIAGLVSIPSMPLTDSAQNGSLLCLSFTPNCANYLAKRQHYYWKHYSSNDLTDKFFN